MSKIRTITLLFLLLICVFVFDMFLGNKIRETFTNKKDTNKKDTSKVYDMRTKELKDKFLMDFKGDLDKSDDQPLFFGFSK